MATVSKFTRGAVSGNGWTNSANLVADDGVTATCSPAKNGTVTGDWDYAAFTDAEIPVGATINSVTMETQFHVSTASSVATFHYQNGDNGSFGTDSTDTTEPIADKIVTTALWSSTPTEADLKTAGRIVSRIAGQRGNSNTGVAFAVDYAKITVDYTPGSANWPVSLSVTATLSPVIAQQKSLLRSLSASSSFSPSLSKTMSLFRSLAATSAMAVGVSKRMSKTLAVTAVLAPTLVASKVFLLALSAASVFSPAISESYVARRALAINSTLSVALTKRINKLLAVASPMTIGIQKKVYVSLAVASVFAVSFRRSIRMTLAVASSFSAGLSEGFQHRLSMIVQSSFVSSLVANFVAGGTGVVKRLMSLLGVGK